VNRTELIEALASRVELTKAAAAKAVDALTEIITAAVAKGNSVARIGFGTVKSAARAARTGRNPKTGEALKIAASMIPKFSAGAALKAAVSGKVATKTAAAKKPAAKAKPAAAKKPAAVTKPAAAKPAAKAAAKPAAAKKPAAAAKVAKKK